MCRLQRIYGAVHCHAISTRQDRAGGGRYPPQFVGQTKPVGQYWLIIKKNAKNSVNLGRNCVNFVGNFVISGKFVCFEKFLYVRKIFAPLKWYTDRIFFGDGWGGGLQN